MRTASPQYGQRFTVSFWVCIAAFLRICADFINNRDNVVTLAVALVGNGLHAVPIGLVKRDDTQVVLYVFDGGYSGSQRRGCKNAKIVPLSLSLNASPGGKLPPKGAEEECGRKSGVQASVQTSYQALRSRRSSSVSVSYCILATGKYRYLYSLRYADTFWELWYDCPRQS